VQFCASSSRDNFGQTVAAVATLSWNQVKAANRAAAEAGRWEIEAEAEKTTAVSA